MGEKYSRLDKMEEIKYMSYREILEKYISLDNACIMEKGKKEIMDVLYKYEEAFSLREEIGSCPSIEVGIDVTDKSPFFLDHITLGKKIRKL